MLKDGHKIKSSVPFLPFTGFPYNHMNAVLVPIAMHSLIRRSTLTIISAIFLFLTSVEAAQVAGTKVLVSQTSATAPQAEFNEVKLLQRQLEDSRRFQDQILSTVYWSLGILAAVAMLLVGFGWFVNFRVYERDKASLERDLRTQMNEDVRTFKTQANEAAAASTASLEQSLVTQLAAAEKRNTAQVKELLDALEQKILARVAANASELRSLKWRVLHLQLEEKLEARQSWQEKKILRNVLQASVSALEIANEIGYENGVAQVLDFVTNDISTILTAKATPIDNFLVAQLIAALDAVKGGHAHAAATLKVGASALLSR